MSTPLPPGLDLYSSKDASEGEATEAQELIYSLPIQQLIGSVLYLANTTRPDISYAAGYLSRFTHKPSTAVWKAGKHLLRYLKGTRMYAIN